ncbi:glycoside hydrolase superfamily [Umbelopsis sp. PMI_123]|nr:glycoside hydrolase superfamily [Umbelopsis sp. PMI_123]
MGSNPFEDPLPGNNPREIHIHVEKAPGESQRPKRKNRAIAAAFIFGSALVIGFVFGGIWGSETAASPTQLEDINASSQHRLGKREIEGRFQALIDGKIEMDEILNDLRFSDSASPNPSVPPLSEPFPYGIKPIRGINLGGWLVLEPFIRPSIFKPYNEGIEKIPAPNVTDRIVDEYTLTKTLGPEKAYGVLKDHYDTWVTKDTFARITQLGFDHVRIPIGYWAVKTWEGDPYVPRLSMAYFLQALEWAREYGLRVNVDLHSAPQSQNGWNHSGRQGHVRWLAKGATNSTTEITQILEVIDVLTQIATSPRYKNTIRIFGVLNEPNMSEMEVHQLLRFYDSAYRLVRSAGFDGWISVSEGFIGLDKWKGKMKRYEGMLLDAHVYQIFDPYSMRSSYREKVVNGVCQGAKNYIRNSGNQETGFGPTIIGEWSAADTDCALWLNNVGQGAHWDGTYYDKGGNLTAKICPKCTCKYRNVASAWPPAYRQFLQMYMQGQIDAFSASYGFFFWNFKIEEGSEPHWSYFDLVDLGIAPANIAEPTFSCDAVDKVPQVFNMSASAQQ